MFASFCSCFSFNKENNSEFGRKVNFVSVCWKSDFSQVGFFFRKLTYFTLEHRLFRLTSWTKTVTQYYCELSLRQIHFNYCSILRRRKQRLSVLWIVMFTCCCPTETSDALYLKKTLIGVQAVAVWSILDSNVEKLWHPVRQIITEVTGSEQKFTFFSAIIKLKCLAAENKTSPN